ncbi:hypothetical protein KA977_15005 [Candidatus Dependentiae bacterium]|nr:hypothetical protein [Candidatus Dependentiae bacterium]
MEAVIKILIIGGLITFAVFLVIAFVKALLLFVPLLLVGVVLYFILFSTWGSS